MYLLDTNACIGYLNGVAVGVLRRMRTLPVAEIAVCSVVKAELFYGAMKSGNPAKSLAEQQRFVNQFISFPFDDQAAEHYGRIRAHLARQGKPIGPNDLLIASIALARNATLVTHNTAEFSRVPNLVIEDWEAT
jgi:tRNA(fMet)-specific endonuclease VapC